jgi:hypothetical protein
MLIGLPGERTQPLNADHRHLCKFPHNRHPNYITLRNALLTIVEGMEQVCGSHRIPSANELVHFGISSDHDLKGLSRSATSIGPR